MMLTFTKRLSLIYCTTATIWSKAVVDAVQGTLDPPLELFNTSRSLRQDICQNITDKYPRDGLDGKALNVWILYEDEYVNLNENKFIDSNNPGIQILMLDEVARRANFTWKNSHTIDEFSATDFNPNRNFTELLNFTTDAYDLSVTWWIHSSFRVGIGGAFPAGWYDASLLIVGPNTDLKREKFNLFAWAQPFSNGVWIALISTLTLTAMFLLLLEGGTSVWKGGCMKGFAQLQFSKNVLTSFLTFTGHLHVESNRSSIHIVLFSLSFFAMIMIAAYTANLASFLVGINMPVTQINSVDDIVRQNSRLCIFDASASEQTIRRKYPTAILVEKSGPGQVLEALHAGECEYAISETSFWRMAKVQNKYNRACNLTQFGSTFGFAQAGFAVRSDAGNKCSSYIRDVMDFHFKAMTDENFIEEAWENHVELVRDNTCTFESGPGPDEPEENEKLTVINVGGIFIFHYFSVFLAVAHGIFRSYYKRRKHVSTRDVAPSNINSQIIVSAVEIKGGNRSTPNLISTNRRDRQIQQRAMSTPNGLSINNDLTSSDLKRVAAVEELLAYLKHENTLV